MHVLSLSFFYSPEQNDIKGHVLGKKLVEKGHRVTALTTFPNYPSGKIFVGYQQKWRQWEKKDGVDLLRVPLYPNHTRSGIKRAASYLSFMLSAAALGLVLTPRPDVMWVYSPPLPTAVAGYWLSLIKRAPFVLEIQDMWPETLASTGMLSNQRALKIIGWVAKFLYKRATAITVNSPGFKQNLIAKGVPAEKIHFLPNWVANEEVYIPQPPEPSLGQQHGLQGRFNVIFGGNLGLAQGLMTLVEAAEKLLDLPDIQMVLIGGGVDLPRLQAAVAARGISNVRFIEHQPPEKMPTFFAWGAALLIHLKDDPLFHITIPSKTLAYFACGRPVIAALRGDGAETVSRAGAGLVCPPEDPAALAQSIRQMYHLSAQERAAMGQAARRAYEEHYQCAIVVAQYEQLFKAILNKN
jgi:glycosyltransferase involved in cell wall biosynthesis